MKRKYISLVALVFTLGFTACNNQTEEVKIEKEEVVDEEISDEEFEKEMEQLDEDVENIENLKPLK
jgi:coenzyme F420-reducing hydrogenase delta subunit